MTPEEKAIIDAKREGFIRGLTLGAPDFDSSEYVSPEQQAAQMYPYPPQRRVVRDEDGYIHTVSEDGYTINVTNMHGHTIASYDREWVNFLRDLFENPDEPQTLTNEPANEIVRKRKYHSRSTDDIWEVTEYLDGRLTCNCPGFSFNKHCWHLDDFKQWRKEIL